MRIVKLEAENFKKQRDVTYIDLAPLEHRLEMAEATNAHHRQYVERQQAVAQAKQLWAEADEITARMKARETERRAVIESAALPIAGLGFSPFGVTYNGLPLEQASSAEQLRVSVAIAMASNPKLRVLRIKDGSLLDERSMAMLQEMADAKEYQCFIEMVDTSGTVGIVMEDGTARVASESTTPKRRRVAAGV